MASDDEMRDCDSMEGGSSPHMLGNNPHALTNGTGGMTAFNMNLDNTEPSTSRASTQDKNLSLRFVWHNTSSLWAQGRVSFFPFPISLSANSQHHHQQNHYQLQQQQQQHHHHLVNTHSALTGQFPSTLPPLNALGNFIGMGGLHALPNLPHNDVLEKLKLQATNGKVSA